ncbi:MAG: hypothetical protein KatS3mg129_0396 [Leptospiraceae bacterium]|nr:MAG: hypothetical protein KatS3mg129_0396 [Leptospiraceae bacterium]
MNRKIIFLAIPYIIIVFYIIYRTIHYYTLLKQDKIYYFSLEGYDPRDLIKGHYFTFRIRYNREEYFSCKYKHKAKIQCACLQEKSLPDTDIKISELQKPLYECNIINQYCDKFIQLECDGYYFQIPQNQYFLSEDLSKYVWRIPENSYIGLLIDKKGKSQIQDIYVLKDDQLIPIIEYAKLQKEKSSN